MTIELALLFAGAFVLGSIPFGVVVSRARGLDIRKVGSGNIGATNVHRALGWKFGLLVMALDASKGFIPALVAGSLGWGPDWALFVGLAAVLGHCFSPFLGFKGGKGIATLCGAALGSTPLVAAASLVVFTVLFVGTQYVSIASMVAVGAAVVFSWLMGLSSAVITTYGLLWVFIIYRHRANVGRLMRGEEPKTSFRGGSRDGTVEHLRNQDQQDHEGQDKKDLDKRDEQALSGGSD